MNSNRELSLTDAIKEVVQKSKTAYQGDLASRFDEYLLEIVSHERLISMANANNGGA
jgi:hypothetical protein